MVITLASGYSRPGFHSLHSQKNLEVKIVGIAEVNQRRCLEESGQWLENVDRNHLILASGNLELQKIKHKREKERYESKPKMDEIKK